MSPITKLKDRKCAACGRDFTHEIDDSDTKDGMPCPSDDCPSHWEEQGKEYKP